MKQSLFQWQPNPAQGAMPSNSPFTDSDESYLTETVVECRVRLESALDTAERYRGQVPELAIALADSLTSIQQALVVLNDLPSYAYVESAND